MKRTIDYSIPAFERFWQDVEVRGARECWPWTGVPNEEGYGWFRPAVNSREKAHRWVLGQVIGRPLRWDGERKELACHTCDLKPCCNPAHLYVGTPRENQRDRFRRSP